MDFLHDFWLIQAIGAIGLVFVIFAWNAKNRVSILSLQSLSTVLFFVHYVLLSAFAGAAMCLVVLGRNFVFAQKDKKWANHPAWFYVFALISVAALIPFWEGWISILPVVAVIIGVHAMSKDRPADMRLYMLAACLLWVPYTIVVGSYSGLLNQIVGIVGILMGMYRHDRKPVIPE